MLLHEARKKQANKTESPVKTWVVLFAQEVQVQSSVSHDGRGVLHALLQPESAGKEQELRMRRAVIWCLQCGVQNVVFPLDIAGRLMQ